LRAFRTPKVVSLDRAAHRAALGTAGRRRAQIISTGPTMPASDVALGANFIVVSQSPDQRPEREYCDDRPEGRSTDFPCEKTHFAAEVQAMNTIIPPLKRVILHGLRLSFHVKKSSLHGKRVAPFEPPPLHSAIV